MEGREGKGIEKREEKARRALDCSAVPEKV